MKTVIAVKAIGRTAPGGQVRLPASQARALVALGHAAYAPEPMARKPRQYQRRDMVAEPVTGVVTSPAQTARLSEAQLGMPAAEFGRPIDGKA